jgi:tRNA pseudouridine38-40 synthase
MTLLLRVEYDGTNYSGWQIQPNARSVQQELETAWYKLTGVRTSIIGAGRTDAGVHGRGQIAHLRLHEDFKIPEHKITVAFNSRLPKDIRIWAVQLTEREVQARFDAISREYSYSISTQESVFNRSFCWQVRFPFNAHRLHDAANLFLGVHNFTTFSKINHDTKNYVCSVSVCEWTEFEHGAQLRIKSDRFVYGMVRSLVGVMMDIARQRRTVEEVRSALERMNRRFISPLAPPQGLVLEKVCYPEEFGVLI